MITYPIRVQPPDPFLRRGLLGELDALRTRDRFHRNRCSYLSGTVVEPVYTSGVTGYTAVASSASEATLLAGSNEQPWIPAGFFTPPSPARRSLRIHMAGVFSNTSTPTLIFQLRLSSTQGVTTYSGTSIGVSAAITTSSGVTNVYWELDFLLTCVTPGFGTGNLTLQGAGTVRSPAGFASPFVYPLEPTTPNTATWTSTIDGALNSYLNASVTWSASSASNTITLKQLLIEGVG